MGINGLNTAYGYTNANMQFRYPANSVSPYLIDNTGIYGRTLDSRSNNFGRAPEIEQNDGKISLGKKIGNFFKGIGNFFKGMVCDENGNFSLGQCLKTVAIGALIAGASVLVPGAGTAIALGFLAVGTVHVGKGIYDAATAKTDEEAEQAWQNIGSGTTEAALAFVGCKKTGAFGKARNAANSVKESAISLKDAYDTAGFDGLRYEGKLQYQNARTSFQNNVIEPTKTNWKNMTDKEVRFNNVKDTYKKNASSYEDGYYSVKDASYQDAVNAVDYYKNEMTAAQKAASAKGATAADKAAYQEAKVKYQAAKTTLDTRVNAGEFKGTTPIDEAEIAARKTAVDNARQALDGSESAYRALADAKADYYRAIAQQYANNGPSRIGDYTFRAKAAVNDGWRQPNVPFLTVVGSGRGHQEPVYAQRYGYYM